MIGDCLMYYFDNNSTTKVDIDVLNEMLPFFSEYYGNASSIHKLGQISKKKMEESREKIANILNCSPNEIYFTSSGSESNNTIIKGIMKASGKKHLITSKIEHSSILNTCKFLESEGYKVTYLNVDEFGVIDLKELEESINDDTALVSIMFANNEIGTIEPIKQIASICEQKNVLFHTDAVQAIGSIDIDLRDLNIDSMTISSHKIYGPKGASILYVKNKVKFNSLINGGYQEQNKRAGTENIAAIVGMGKALELNYQNRNEKNKYVKELRDYFELKLKEEIINIKINGNLQNRLLGTSNVTIKGFDAATLLIALDMRNICISTGSACLSRSILPSHVLKAIGLDDNDIKSSIRVSFGKYNTKEEIDYLIMSIKEIVGK